MAVIKRKFFHVRQSLRRRKVYWQKKIYDKMWKIWKREKRIK